MHTYVLGERNREKKIEIVAGSVRVGTFVKTCMFCHKFVR